MANVNVNVQTTNSGYQISIDPFRAHITAAGEAIVWDSNCPIKIDLDHKAHFPEFVSHAYGTHQESGPIANSTVAPKGTYHYRISILVNDTEDALRDRGYKNEICIDPDYKVDR